MNIYISLPITGIVPDEVEASATYAAGVLEKKGHTYVSPLDINDPDSDYNTCMGRCIHALLGCDAVVVLEGWSCSKGCRLEAEAAKIYGKPLYKGLDAVPENNALWYQFVKEDKQ
jgi:hypothetical protein